MTVDDAIAVSVRLDTVVMALIAAIERVKEADEDDTSRRIDFNLHEAHRHAAVARGLCRGFMNLPPGGDDVG